MSNIYFSVKHDARKWLILGFFFRILLYMVAKQVLIPLKLQQTQAIWTRFDSLFLKHPTLRQMRDIFKFLNYKWL